MDFDQICFKMTLYQVHKVKVLNRTWYDKAHIWPPENSFFKSLISIIKMYSYESSNLECNSKHKINQFLHKIFVIFVLNIPIPPADSDENDEFGSLCGFQNI